MGSLNEQWRSYFETHCQADLETVEDDFPSTQSISLDLVALHSTNQELAQAVLKYPDQALSEAQAVVRDLLDVSGPVQVQVENNPHQCGVRAISADQLHKLITVQGAVETIAPIKAAIVTAHYICPACNTTINTSSTGIENVEPTRCEKCDWDGPFEFQPPQSEFIDAQRLMLAPVSDQDTDNTQRQSLPVYIYGDLIGGVTNGDHIGVTGILRVRYQEKAPLQTLYLDGHGIRKERDLSFPESLETALDSYWETSATHR